MSARLGLWLRVARLAFAAGVWLGLAGLLLWLAAWQWSRYQDARARTIPPAESRLPFKDARNEPLALTARHIVLHGRFLPRTDFLWTPSPPGWIAMSPFRLTDNGTLLVDRGFAPAQNFEPKQFPQAAPSEPLALNATLLEVPRASPFAPPAQEGIWYHRAPAQILPPSTATLTHSYASLAAPLAFADDTPTLAAPPRAFSDDATTLAPQRHLGYALTWLLLAVAMLVVTALAVRRRHDKS